MTELFTTFLSCLHHILFFFKCQYDIKITHPKNSRQEPFFIYYDSFRIFSQIIHVFFPLFVTIYAIMSIDESW